VRRALVLVVVAATVAVVAGLSIPSSAISVNTATISQSELNGELAAIQASPTYQCFLSAQSFLNGQNAPTPVHGVSMPSWFATTTVEWSNIRATDLAIIGYVQVHDPRAISPAVLGAPGPLGAKAQLESAMNSTIQTAYAQSGSRAQGFSCPGLSAPPAGVNVGALALNSMPAWFQDEQIEANAAELALQHLTPSPLPTAGPALEAWFNQHAGEFATTCLSYIQTVDLAHAEVAARAIAGGLSFAEAAKRYSIDTTTKDKGGALGCYSPSSPSWGSVQHYVGHVATGHVSAPQPFPHSASYLLFTVTKRTPNAFDAIKGAVASANGAANRTSAVVLAVEIQRAADITVSPAIGTWLVTVTGGTIVPPTPPPASSVTNATANVPVP